MIRILDFDGSVTAQKKLLARYNPCIIDLTDIGPAARFFTNKKIRDEVSSRIAISEAPTINFLGSGDFHHISEILLCNLGESVSVIDFDMHPDWHVIPPRYGCGSWVRTALRSNVNIAKLVIIGASSIDLMGISIQTADFPDMENDRLEVYPYSHRPSNVFFRNVPDNISVGLSRGPFRTAIRWSELRTKNIAEFFLHTVKRLPTKKVYVTVDKDCLKRQHAVTNWEEGMISLDELIIMLKIIRDNCEIAGLDITGEYSKISVDGPIKTVLSRIDHPKETWRRDTSEEAALSVNEETNIRILETLNL